MMRQRAAIERKLDSLSERIRLMGGPAAGGAKRARNEISLIEAIERVLSQAKKPLSVGEIYKNVLAIGYRSNSPKFRAIVNQTLIKERRFSQIERGVYALKG
jgi:DNA-binding ferritin-like protein